MIYARMPSITVNKNTDVKAAIPFETPHFSSLRQKGKIITAKMIENKSGTIITLSEYRARTIKQTVTRIAARRTIYGCGICFIPELDWSKYTNYVPGSGADGIRLF